MGCWKLKKSFLLFTLFPVGPLSKGHISLLPFQSIHWPSALKCRTDVEGLRIFYRWNEPHWPKVHLKPPKGGVSRHTSREFIALLVEFVATALKYLKDANCRWSHKWGILLFSLPKCLYERYCSSHLEVNRPHTELHRKPPHLPCWLKHVLFTPAQRIKE